MRIAYALTLLFALLLISCQEKSNQELEKNQDGFNSYFIDIKSDHISFIDQVASIEMLGFEETEQSLLKANMVYLEYESGYILVDENNGTVFIFNADGTFKNKFNRKGQGPEEYAYMEHTRYRDGLIETYVYNSQKVMQYSLEGNFIRYIKAPYPAAHVFYFNNGYILGMGNQVELDSINHDVVFTDSQMRPYAFALPFAKPKGVALSSPVNEFRMYDGNVLFNPFWTDSVYQIKNDKVTPFIHFDFGEDWLWDHFPMTRSLDGKTMNAMTDEGKVWAYEWAIGNERIDMTYMTSLNLPAGTGYIDRATGEFHNYDFDWLNREGLPFRSIKYVDDKLLVVFSTDVLADFIDALGEAKAETLGKLRTPQVLESENPVLVWIKFK